MDMGRLLHDYELDMLSTEDKQQFELHLYECDHCLSLVREFMSVSRIIRHDQDARAIVQDIVGEQEDRTSRPTQTWASPYIKLLIAAVICVAIALPVHRYWLQSDKTSVVQTLELLPSRAGGNDIIYLEKGGDVEISFFVAEQFQGEADLIISSIAGDTVLHTPGFSDFNDQGLGSITLSVSKFSDAHYMLTIIPVPETGLEERIYMFRVK
jgi:hypothetical protein